MKIFTRKEVERIKNALVANYIIAADALDGCVFADNIEVKEYLDSKEVLVKNTLCSAIILGVHDEVEKMVSAYQELKLKQMEEEEK